MTDPDRDQLSRRLSAAVSAARIALGRPDVAGTITPAGLDALASGLEALGGEAADGHAEDLERLRDRYEARFDALQNVEGALARIRRITSPPGMLGSAPKELSASSGLTRVVLSLVRNGRMVAEAAHFRGDGLGAVHALEALAANPPRLEHPLLETELARRRRATIVADASAHPRVSARWTHVMGWSSYVAAPLVVNGEVIGLLHADAAGTDRRLDVLDGDVLWAFARGLADAYETASLRRSLRRQAEEMRGFVEWLRAESISLGHVRIELAQQPATPSEPPGHHHVGAIGPGVDDRVVFEGLLSRRELEVLRFVARGDSNHAIAAQLVISEATVKSHVMRILRKLHAGNRAEAAARYHRLVLRTEPQRLDRAR